MPILFAILIVFVVTVSIGIYYKSEKDTERYSCYLRKMFKGIANRYGCAGDGAPDCKHCLYHKIYLREHKNERTK